MDWLREFYFFFQLAQEEFFKIFKNFKKKLLQFYCKLAG